MINNAILIGYHIEIRHTQFVVILGKDCIKLNLNNYLFIIDYLLIICCFLFIAGC